MTADGGDAMTAQPDEFDDLRERLARAVAATVGSHVTAGDRTAVDAVLNALAVCGYRIVPYGETSTTEGTQP